MMRLEAIVWKLEVGNADRKGSAFLYERQIALISARKATPRERHIYEEKIT